MAAAFPGQFLSRLYSEPWLISKAHLQAWLRAAMQGASFAPEASEDGARQPELFTRFGGTALIEVCGPILKNPDAIEVRYFGACDIDQVRAAAELARTDDTVERVALYVNSPGGTVTGVPECADALAQLCLEKPLYGFTDAMACSAGYWLLAQAQGIYMTRSARVGSIGVYALYLDESKALEEMGLVVNAISVGKMKLAGASFKPLTDEERAYFQGSCDRIAAEFKEAIQVNRTLAKEHMEGQVFDAEPAVEAGLVDGVVSGFDEVLQMARGT